MQGVTSGFPDYIHFVPTSCLLPDGQIQNLLTSDNYSGFYTSKRPVVNPDHLD